MRFAELALLSTPLLLLGAWLLGARHASFRSLAVLALALACLGGVLYWAGDERSFTGHYVPARLQDGRVVPGTSR